MKRFTRHRLLIACSILLLTFSSCWAPAAPAREPLVVFLVRHGEKSDADRDPELSPAGKARARTLVDMLRDAGITHVHSSDFIRTRDTAAPLATARGLDLQLYDPNNLPALIQKVRSAGGRHLIVGHSNTTPQAVALLGGEPGQPIEEAAEFDRLYIVTIGPDDHVTTVLLRYGKPFRESARLSGRR